MLGLADLDREQLYELVWSEAMATLGPKLQISDVGLKKRCRRLGIPTPPRGYWAKIEAGKPVKKAPLPDSWSIPRKAKKVPKSAEEVSRLAVPERTYDIDRRHPAVVAAAKTARTTKAADDGLLYVLGDCPHLRISRDLLPRGLWLWQELIGKLPAVDLKLIAAGSQVTDGRETVHLELKEMLGKYEQMPDPEHRRLQIRLWGEDRPDTKWTPTGVLVFRAEEVYGAGCSHQWRESTLRRMEDRLDDVASGLAQLLRRKYELRLEREELNRRWEEERRRSEEIAAQRKHEGARRRKLLRLVSASDKAEGIRRLCARVLSHSGPLEDDALQPFVQWAVKLADALDPVHGIVESVGKGEDPCEPDHEDLYPRT